MTDLPGVPDHLDQPCAGCGAPAGTPCRPDCLGLADFEDQVLGITDPPDQLEPHLQAALERAVRAQAASTAATDLNEIYIALTDNANSHVVDPTIIEAQLGGARVPDDLAVWLSRCYRETYTTTLNDTLHVINADDTPGQQALRDHQGLPAEMDAHNASWDADLDKIRRLRDLAYPHRDQLSPPPPAADHDNPAAPPNPFTHKPGRDNLPPPPLPPNPFRRPDPGPDQGPQR